MDEIQKGKLNSKTEKVENRIAVVEFTKNRIENVKMQNVAV